MQNNKIASAQKRMGATPILHAFWRSFIIALPDSAVYRFGTSTATKSRRILQHKIAYQITTLLDKWHMRYLLDAILCLIKERKYFFTYINNSPSDPVCEGKGAACTKSTELGQSHNPLYCIDMSQRFLLS